MKNDILKAGLVILGVYFLVNGSLGLMSGCIQYIVWIFREDMSSVSNVSRQSPSLFLWYCVVPFGQTVVGALLVSRPIRRKIISILEDKE